MELGDAPSLEPAILNRCSCWVSADIESFLVGVPGNAERESDPTTPGLDPRLALAPEFLLSISCARLELRNGLPTWPNVAGGNLDIGRGDCDVGLKCCGWDDDC